MDSTGISGTEQQGGVSAVGVSTEMEITGTVTEQRNRQTELSAETAPQQFKGRNHSIAAWNIVGESPDDIDYHDRNGERRDLETGGIVNGVSTDEPVLGNVRTTNLGDPAEPGYAGPSKKICKSVKHRYIMPKVYRDFLKAMVPDDMAVKRKEVRYKMIKALGWRGKKLPSYFPTEDQVKWRFDGLKYLEKKKKIGIFIILFSWNSIGTIDFIFLLPQDIMPTSAVVLSKHSGKRLKMCQKTQPKDNLQRKI